MRLQGRGPGDQRHPRPQPRLLVGRVTVRLDHAAAQRLHQRQVGTPVERLPQPLHHPVEVTPGDVVLRLEVPEEGASTDTDRGGDVLDRRRLEPALGEEAEGDSFDLLAGGGGGSS